MSFKINKVYTRSGDDGKTTLADGARYEKHGDVIEAMGLLDEVNVELGASLDYLDSKTAFLKDTIENLQQEIFDIGAELARPLEKTAWTTTEEHIKNIENLCDKFGQDLPELNSFILPGGSKLATAIHRARTTTRRAERAFSKLNANPNSLSYLNRLSDALFNMARLVLKKQDKQEILWEPSTKRS